jgi:hypothetical protein
MKAIDTTTTPPGRDTHADDDVKVNDKLEFSSDSLDMLQRKLEATNKSILSTLIQHEEEQKVKDEKKERKILHLLHELPLDSEIMDELVNEALYDSSDAATVGVVDEVGE